MKRLLLCLMLAAMTAAARADWQTFLREEPTTQKRDDRVFVTLDRLFKAEREAAEADRPYIGLYTTLVLARARYQFRYAEEKAVPDPAAGACQGWTRAQAQALLEARVRADLTRLDLFAKAPATPFLSATWTDPDAYDTSALAVYFQNVLSEMPKETFPRLRAQVLEAARSAGDDALEGTIRLVTVNEKPFEEQRAALEALDKERLWPADVRALILRGQSETLTKDEETVRRMELLLDARDLARDHRLKANLQREINAMRQAEVRIERMPSLVPVGEPLTLNVRYRNTDSFSVVCEAWDGGEAPKDAAWQIIDDKMARVFSLPEAKAYIWAEATVTLPALPAGKHTLTLNVPQHFTGLRPAPGTCTVTAADFTAARVHNEPLAIYVADIRTGQPIEGAVVTLKGEKWQGREEVSQQTDALGLATFRDIPSARPGYHHVVFTTTWKGQTIEARDGFSTRGPVQDARPQLQVLADRYLYRPGETVRFQAMALRRDVATDRVLPDPTAKGTLVLRGHPMQGAPIDLATFALTPSAKGTFSGEFTLPTDFVGSISATVEAWRAYADVGRVIEFKAPTFTVTLERANVGAPLSDPVRFSGKAIDLTGTPLAGATVKWKVNAIGDPIEGTAAVGADGAFAFEALLPTRDRDQYVSATASVLNTNGERQEAQAAAWIPQWGFQIAITPEQWAISDTPFNVTLSAERAVQGELTVLRDGETNVLRRVNIALAQVEPGRAEDVVPLTLPGGSYTLMTVSGAVTNSTGAIVVPKDGDFDVFPESWRDTGALLRIKPNTDATLKIGDTLMGFAGALGDGAKFLCITARNGMRSVLPLTKPFFDLPIEADLAPGFALTVYAFDGAQFCTATQQFQVAQTADLKVEATRFAETAAPGSAQTWEITVDDPEAELLVTCYDKAMDEIIPYAWRTFAEAFPGYHHWWGMTAPWFTPARNLWVMEPLPWDFCEYGHDTVNPGYVLKRWQATRGSAIVMKKTRAEMALDAAAPAPSAMAKRNYLGDQALAAAEGVGGAAQPPARIRTNFAKTALWAPQKRLKDGKAVFTFTLPDTLTTWKLMAFAYTADGRSGTLTRDCQARLDVMLQPYLPRVLRVGDKLTLAVRLTNTTDKSLDTWAELNRAERQTVTLPPKGTATVSWQVAAQAVPGTQTFEFATEGDAVRLDLPVLDNRVTVEDVYPITLVDTKPSTIDVAEPTTFHDLVTRWNHAPAKAVADALKSVFGAPYESCDTLLAKLTASLLLRQTDRSAATLDEREEEWLNRLLAARKDGLWPWFPGGAGDGYVTAEICIGTARLHRLGFAPKALEEAVMDTLKARPELLSYAAWVYARSAFVDVWPMEADITDAVLMAYREAKTVQERRLLAIAAKRLGITEVAERGLKDITDAINRSDTWGVWWPQERLWWVWWGTPLESHALGIEALVENGRAEDACAAARWLLQHRRLNDWGSTRATLAAAFALRLVDTPETTVQAAPKLRVDSERLPGVRRITYARETPGLSFGSVVATYTLPLEQVPAPKVGDDAALTLTRTYSPANPKVGDTVTVTLRITAAQPMSHAWLRDERPANTEPVRQLPSWDWQTGAYAVPGDVGTDFFLGTLPRGMTTIQYTLKVTHAGTCVPGLATLKLTHAPDFAARTATEPFTVAP